MRTVKALAEHDVPVGIHDNLMYTLLEDSVKHERFSTRFSPSDKALLLRSKVRCAVNIASCLQRLARSKGQFALMVNPSVLVNNLTDDDVHERQFIWPLDESFMNAPAVVYFARDHPLEEQFSVYLRRLQAGGVTSIMFKRDATDSFWLRRRSGLRPRPLPLRDLGPVLEMVGKFVLPISFICFLLEIIFGRL